MKKIVLLLLPFIGIFQSCSNKNKATTSDLGKRKTDTLLLRKSEPRNTADSSYIDTNMERYSRPRPTHAAHFSSNTPHYHNGQYHNGNY